MGTTEHEHTSSIILSIKAYLRQLLESKSSVIADADSLGVALDCLGEAFGDKINVNAPTQDLGSLFGATTAPVDKPFADEQTEARFQQYLSILAGKGLFGEHAVGSTEYNTRLVKARSKYMESVLQKQVDAAKPQWKPSEVSEANLQLSEQFKKKANDQIAAKEYEAAIQSYTSAIEHNPDNAVLYSNRAAAYSHLGQHEKAVHDSEMAVLIKPDYHRAYSRIGLGYFNLGKFDASIQAYEKALKLDPNNVSYKDSLETAKNALAKSNTPSPAPSTNTGQPTGKPDLSGLMSMMGNMFKGANNNAEGGEAPPNPLEGMFGGGGGMPDITKILSDPNFSQLASTFMNNPQMREMAANMANDPNMMKNLSSMFGGGPPSQ